MAASIAILACLISASRSKNNCSLLFTIPSGSNPYVKEENKMCLSANCDTDHEIKKD
jgi:hypothetical protein